MEISEIREECKPKSERFLIDHGISFGHIKEVDEMDDHKDETDDVWSERIFSLAV